MNQTFRILSLIEMCNPTWGEQKASVSRKNSFGLIILQFIAWALQIILFSFQLYHWYQNLIWHWCDTKTWYIWHWCEIKSIAVEAELVQSVAHFSAKAYNLQSSQPCRVVSSVPLLTSDWNVLSLVLCVIITIQACVRDAKSKPLGNGSGNPVSRDFRRTSFCMHFHTWLQTTTNDAAPNVDNNRKVKGSKELLQSVQFCHLRAV